MSYLTHVEPYVDPALRALTQNSLDKISGILIALRRIRGSWMKYFEDFISFLKKLEKQDPDLYIYPKYINYLRGKLEAEPLEKLFDFLSLNGYNEDELTKILLNKSFDEGAFINRLPKPNSWYLWLCVFYLYTPRLSQKFFWENLEYLDKDERELINNYRSLPLDLQERVFKYTKSALSAEHLNQIIKRTPKNEG